MTCLRGLLVIWVVWVAWVVWPALPAAEPSASGQVTSGEVTSGPVTSGLVASGRTTTTQPTTSPSTGERSVPLIALGGIIACRGSIDGHDGLLIIDTGSSGTCLFPAQVRGRHYAFRRVDQTCYTANGVSHLTRVVRRATITLGGAPVTAIDLAVLPGAGAPSAIGLLGCDYLRAMGAQIDLEHQRLVIHPRSASR